MFKLSGGFVTCIPKLKGMNTLLGEANLSGVFALIPKRDLCCIGIYPEKGS